MILNISIWAFCSMTISYALYLTHDPYCLWALLIPLITNVALEVQKGLVE
jgi:hypothetical protein